MPSAVDNLIARRLQLATEQNPDAFKINSKIKSDEGWEKSIRKDKLAGFNQL